MIDQELLKILACPETKSPVKLADKALIEKLNLKIKQGLLSTRGGEKIKEEIDGGLIPESNQKILYPIRQDIPVMLIDEAIPLEGV